MVYLRYADQSPWAHKKRGQDTTEPAPEVATFDLHAHELGVDDVGDAADLLQHRARDRIVHFHDGDGATAPPLPPELHAGDIHVVLAEHRSDPADDPRHIQVGEDQHVTLQEGLQPEAVDVHHPRVL